MNTEKSVQENPEYNYLTIVDRISRTHRSKEINEGDILEWSSECEREHLQDVDNMIGYAGIELTVKNRKALIPCNVYRILSVYSKRGDISSKVPFRKVGLWLHFNSTYTSSKVYIDFYGIRLDSDGLPVIPEEHLYAVENFCIEKMYYEDFLLQKLSSDRYQVIYEKMVNSLRDARTSMRNMTLDDLNSLHFIQYNMIPKIGSMDFVTNDLNTHVIDE